MLHGGSIFHSPMHPWRGHMLHLPLTPAAHRLKHNRQVTVNPLDSNDLIRTASERLSAFILHPVLVGLPLLRLREPQRLHLRGLLPQ